jgi:hypothetical protein
LILGRHDFSNGRALAALKNVTPTEHPSDRFDLAIVGMPGDGHGADPGAVGQHGLSSAEPRDREVTAIIILHY